MEFNIFFFFFGNRSKEKGIFDILFLALKEY